MEQKRFTGRNVLVLVLVIALIALAAVIAAVQPRSIDPTAGTLATDAPAAVPEATEAPEVTEVPEATNVPEATEVPEETAAVSATNAPADAYLVVTVAGRMYEPIPLYEPGRYTVTRGEHVNIIEVTEDSVWMDESSCDNQDCVEQGVVSLENRSGRVLQNMIICLPNEVMLELYNQEELVSLLMGMIEGAEADE